MSGQISHLTFTLSTAAPSTFSPRLGTVFLRRNDTYTLTMHTPGLLTTTSRGVVPHLSRDHAKNTKAIQWISIPFETFLEHKPPVPTLQQGATPLHTFLGYEPNQHILSMTLRDPNDGREMPPNGQAFVSAYTLQGVRKVTPADWRSYIAACKPDVAIAMPDIPLTNTLHSQKRLTKSIDRSSAWLCDLIRYTGHTTANPDRSHPASIIVQMAGGINTAARRAFADGLLEVLYGPEATAIEPLRCFDEGVSGYVFDLLPLRQLLERQMATEVSENNINITPQDQDWTDDLISLLKSSLAPLPKDKLRLVNSAQSPQEMLRMIQHVGIDIFDSYWAQRAADIGVALDFSFPVQNQGPNRRPNGKRDLGHNLYQKTYAHDFSPLANCFPGGPESDVPLCSCLACVPTTPSQRISHSSMDLTAPGEERLPAFTRAYLHHLLHTHEMSAHSLLVMHNISVLDAMLTGARSVITEFGLAGFGAEVDKFALEYDGMMCLFNEARAMWHEVELARGKGRLAREKEKEKLVG